jgi:hypothetical protein
MERGSSLARRRTMSATVDESTRVATDAFGKVGLPRGMQSIYIRVRTTLFVVTLAFERSAASIRVVGTAAMVAAATTTTAGVRM